MTVDVKAAARRLAERLPSLAQRCCRSGQEDALEARGSLVTELESFALACAGQTAASSSVSPTAPGSDVLARFDAAMSRAAARQILVDHLAAPPQGIVLTDDEIDETIAVMLDNAWQNANRRTALAKFIEARGSR